MTWGRWGSPCTGCSSACPCLTWGEPGSDVGRCQGLTSGAAWQERGLARTRPTYLLPIQLLISVGQLDQALECAPRRLGLGLP